ncbi:S13-like H2TH domain-containing protein [Calocera cornea HHB12733]|uniref:S13-like H2TH domain-containing protein n=1 Tax=Calocera cornea HHB12733 TaxID=1353952 RepID=A0A165CR72_9BASI|nr:S13-like H2TH domain-containing protein [Calocera cornea HHB12733]
MFVLGVNLPDNHLVWRALRSFYGLNYHTGKQVCARFQIHLKCRVSELSNTQLAALGAFLSSPATAAPPLRCRRAGIDEQSAVPLSAAPPAPERARGRDVLRELKLESEGRRVIRENIAHHREIGTYVGRRHAMHLPVRGQKTKRNARTAARLNRIDRRGFATWCVPFGLELGPSSAR